MPEVTERRFRREIVSFSRRGDRLTERQQRAWDALADTHVIDVPRDLLSARLTTSVDPAFELDLKTTFGRSAPLIIEIGSGRGESLVHAALEHPDVNFLGIEVYIPGVAQGLVSMRHAGATNIRFVVVDAVEAFRTMLPPHSAREVRTWFPDPWHKKRHNKRRLVQPEFASLVARVLEPGGWWRLATDWAHYGEHMADVLADAPEFETTGSPTERFAGRPVTRFEAKGIAAGRGIIDLSARSRLPS